MQKQIIVFICILSFLWSCKPHEKIADEKATDIVQPEPEPKQPVVLSFHLENAKQWLLQNTPDSTQLQIAYALNRMDGAHFAKKDSVIIANDMSGNITGYLPFPLQVPYLKDINKIIFFSYPAQIFAAYEKGILIYTGPTNMGRKKDPTPTGLFYTNWKAEETTSTFNDEWDLRWNFNIANKAGIGWHQYSLPGSPVSHSCLRLQEKDAQYLYNWAEQWDLDAKDNIQAKGTPVIIFGKYNFSAPKPWLQLIANPTALTITEAEMEKQTIPYLAKILVEQTKREARQAKKI